MKTLFTNNNNNIEVFDIVTAPYSDINGVRKIGIFLVIYTENKDPNDFNNRNLTGLKLTSKDLYANVYRTLVSKSDLTMLAKDSFIYSNKVTTLLSRYCRVIATLPQKLRGEVLQKYLTYSSQVLSQTLKGVTK